MLLLFLLLLFYWEQLGLSFLKYLCIILWSSSKVCIGMDLFLFILLYTWITFSVWGLSNLQFWILLCQCLFDYSFPSLLTYVSQCAYWVLSELPSLSFMFLSLSYIFLVFLSLYESLWMPYFSLLIIINIFFTFVKSTVQPVFEFLTSMTGYFHFWNFCVSSSELLFLFHDILFLHYELASFFIS